MVATDRSQAFTLFDGESHKAQVTTDKDLPDVLVDLLVCTVIFNQF